MVQVLAGIKNFLIFWILMTGLIVLSASPMVFTIFGRPISEIWQGILRAGFSLESIIAFVLSSLIGFIVLLVFVALPIVVQLLGHIALKVARNTMRRSLHDIQGQDTRAPILFLRSFLGDQVALKSRGWRMEQWLLDESSRSLTLDYLLLSEGTHYGPTVALCNPGDPAPPYGAARGYFEHATWKSAVRNLCVRSAAIVMVLDTTEVVEWEIGHIVAENHVTKTMFPLAPGDVGAARGMALLSSAVKACGGDEQEFRYAAATPQETLGFCRTPAGDIQPLTSSTLSVYSYIVALRCFLRGLIDDQDGDNRDGNNQAHNIA